MSLRSPLAWPLIVTVVLSGGVVITRAAIGPFHLLLGVNSPLVAEGICALAGTLLLLLNGTKPSPPATSRVPIWPALAAILLVTAAATAASLRFPLVCDEYELAAESRTVNWTAFTHPATTDRFFRPLADLSLRLDALWADTNPFGWRILGFVLHLANTALLFTLTLRLFGRASVALWAAALFGMHGSRPEAVVFLARFDQLATFFVLAGLLLFERSLLASVAAMLAALACKESAYIFPLLVVWLMALRGRRDFKIVLPFFALAAIAFLYRWWVLGGIGGYPDSATGRPAILNIRPLALLKGFTIRSWGLLYFPINWSRPPEPWLAAAMALTIAALLCLILASRASRRDLAFAAAFVPIASLPVAHMLLIGADLEGAAHIYLPSAGFCLFLAIAIDAVPTRAFTWATGAALLIFQLAALAHNMAIWDRTAHLADALCRNVASEAARSGGTVIVRDPPRILNGVPYFVKGLPECVAMHQPGAKAVVVFGPDHQ